MNAEPTEISVQRTVTVPIDVDKAFELFTARMGEFWPKHHSIGASEIAAVVAEPRVGGRWFERGVDGTECVWGKVAEWAPPGRVVLVWQIGADWQFNPELETEVEIVFTPDADGTRVDLTHRHLERYGEQAQAMHEIFNSPGGWDGTLDAFVRLAA